MTPDLGSHRQQALFALHFANFDVAAIDDDFLGQPDTESFELVFDAGERRSLSVAWDAGGPAWAVVGRFSPSADPSAALNAAMTINSLLPQAMRLQASPEGSEIEVIAALPSLDLPLEDLANLIMEVVGWLHRVADSVERQPAPEVQGGSFSAAGGQTPPNISTAPPGYWVRG
jgi:hypothetical protein